MTTTHGRFSYDLFVAHAPADAAWVNGFLLPALGVPAERIITEDRYRLGAVVVEEFERAVSHSRFTVLVLTPAFLVDAWASFGEQLAVFANAAERENRLVPLQLQPCESPLRVRARVGLDCTHPADWEREVARLRALLDQPAPVVERPACPYRGIAPFRSDDAQYFHGRNQEIDDLSRRARRQPFVMVIGPSGSGKSSLIFAGLVAQVGNHHPNEWSVRSLRPGAAPVDALATALGAARADLERNGASGAIIAMLADDSPSERVLLVVDQFEELFVQAPRDERAAFFSLLRELRRVPRCVVVATMRADFYPELMNCELWPLLPGERVEIVPLRGASLREAIERPAADVGMYVEPALVERLLADAADEPGVLTLLQETLMLLWERAERRLMTLWSYEQLGGQRSSGLAVALAERADAVVTELTPAERAIARRILVRLIQLGEGRDDTRRQQPVDSLRAVDDVPEQFSRTLQHLTKQRLLTLTGKEGEQSSRVDMAHEALISGWPTLRQWLDDDRAAELRRRQIERDALDWQRANGDRAALYRGSRLRTALEWRRNYRYDVSGPIQAFISASRQLDVLRKTVTAVLILLLLIPLQAVRQPISAWLLRRQAIRSSPMVSFPAGPAVLGGLDAATVDASVDPPRMVPIPRRRVRLMAFSLDVHEVTNRQYRLCFRADRCTPPAPQADLRFEDASPDLPVVLVNAYQAAVFCRWLGRRLPTEAEWERAARGVSGRRWPWGTQQPTAARVNLIIDKPRGEQLASVFGGASAGGATPEGVTHLLGNAKEWTATPSGCKPTIHTCANVWDGRRPLRAVDTRGRGFDEQLAAVSQPDEAEPSTFAADLGFRCAK
jgi:formylglycine-generating enzyme required for sulfatase activity